MELWVDVGHLAVQRRLPFLHVARDLGIARVLVRDGDPHLERRDIPWSVVHAHDIRDMAGRVIAKKINLASAADQEHALRIEGPLVVDAHDWRIVPLENLLAARAGPTFAVARDEDDARVLLDVLDRGVDGLVLAPSQPGTIAAVHRLLGRRAAPDIDELLAEPTHATGTAATKDSPGPDAEPADHEPTAQQPQGLSGTFLVAATITEIRPAGAGDRVCVDATTQFRKGEGLLLGSTCTAFALVLAETAQTEFIAPRPFRVNAGAMHNYVFAGRTNYLSELQASSPILAIHHDGVHRVAHVGRAKIERRPHLLIRWKGGSPGMVVLQNAETVRIAGPGGPIPVTGLRPGDQIWVHEEASGRHAGHPIAPVLEK